MMVTRVSFSLSLSNRSKVKKKSGDLHTIFRTFYNNP